MNGARRFPASRAQACPVRVRSGLALAGLLSLAACGAPPPVNHPEMSVDLPENWTGRFAADSGSGSASADSASVALASAAPVAWWRQVGPANTYEIGIQKNVSQIM